MLVEMLTRWSWGWRCRLWLLLPQLPPRALDVLHLPLIANLHLAWRTHCIHQAHRVSSHILASEVAMVTLAAHGAFGIPPSVPWFVLLLAPGVIRSLIHAWSHPLHAASDGASDAHVNIYWRPLDVVALRTTFICSLMATTLLATLRSTLIALLATLIVAFISSLIPTLLATLLVTFLAAFLTLLPSSFCRAPCGNKV